MSPRHALLERALRAAAERAADPGGLRFTERQLYYELCRGLRPWHRAPRRLPFSTGPPVRTAAFSAALRRAGDLPGLLPPAAPPTRRPAGHHTPEPDLFDYGLPRLLVCESDDIARMLRANGLPMESACPVYGAGELPLDPGVSTMLTQAERATVYVLHDASPAGLAFAAHAAGLAGVPDGVGVVPIGLRPRQAGALHLPHRPRGSAAAGAAAADTPADPWERRWLGRGRAVEVAAVRPAALLRTVHRLVREIRRRPPPAGLRRAREVGFLSWPAA
ncbi:hypothetical protein [Streptomyces sp. MP131-18]|uniref:hypothetical protein n=1 Tax=Streptomyces sp. MP131-18 TaxID=1857892 RepID=UPI00097C80A6|nr:hypothetical protein [Streptomyces sp. MP131-18]ONK11264.1 hypothetical protein STBA_19950 [Streptomyces sp. MP131-18]